MFRLDIEELRKILDWIAIELEKHNPGSIDANVDFYKVPNSLGWFFDLKYEGNEFGYGSFVDEVDLLRKSILSGEDDLPEVVMERTGYLLLYLAYRAGERPNH